MAGGGIDSFMAFSKEGTAETDGGKAPAILGETQDAFQRRSSETSLNDSIQISSYEFGFSTNFDSTETREVQRHYPEFRPLKVTKGFDRASPRLLEAVYYAARYDAVYLWQRRAGVSQDRAGTYFLVVVLYDVTVNDVDWTTSENSPYPEETIILGYRTINVDYMPQLSTGALSEKGVGTHDLSLVSGHGQENGSKGEDKANGKNKAKGSLSDADLDKRILAILRKHNVPVRA